MNRFPLSFLSAQGNNVSRIFIHVIQIWWKGPLDCIRWISCAYFYCLSALITLKNLKGWPWYSSCFLLNLSLARLITCKNFVFSFLFSSGILWSYLMSPHWLLLVLLYRFFRYYITWNIYLYKFIVRVALYAKCYMGSCHWKWGNNIGNHCNTGTVEMPLPYWPSFALPVELTWIIILTIYRGTCQFLT